MSFADERARHIILSHGRAASAYQLLNPGISYWFPREGGAVVGFVRHAGVRVVAGMPVAPERKIGAVTRAFEQDAAREHERVCYFGVDDSFRTRYCSASEGQDLILGGQPVWNPQGWKQIVANKASLRAQLHRAKNKGVEISELSDTSSSIAAELQSLLHAWLQRKPLPPMRFLVEPDTLSNLQDRQVLVAREADRITGFLVASPVPARQGWLVEQVIRHPDAANGTSELLIHHAACAAATSGDGYFTLGLAPLTERHVTREAVSTHWLWMLLSTIRRLGRPFFNFAGLEYFKAKFQPHRWEPLYAVTPEPRFTPTMMYAVAAAFTGGLPFRWMLRAFWKKARQR